MAELVGSVRYMNLDRLTCRVSDTAHGGNTTFQGSFATDVTPVLLQAFREGRVVRVSINPPGVIVAAALEPDHG